MSRNLQLDFFRGLFLIIITTNHFLSWHNIIHYFTYEFVGWVTAAEGFVFLSGLTAGLVYSRKLVEKGQLFIANAAKKRAWTIYKYHLGLFLLVTIILFSHPIMKDHWFHNYQEFKLIFHQPVSAILLSCVLFYQPVYLDILPMYAIYIWLLPFALKYFQRGYQGRVLLVSFLLYIIGSFDLLMPLFDNIKIFDQVDAGFFNLLSWQFLFIVGLFFGHLSYKNKTSSILQNKTLFYCAVAVSITLFILKNTSRHFDFLHFDFEFWTDKGDLRPLRLLNFFALLSVVGYTASKYKHWFTFKPICYLGRYSLEVFALHIILIVLFSPLKEYSNKFFAIKVSNYLHIYPLASLLLLFVLIPALFLAPLLKNTLKERNLKLKPSV
ncbi:MAG: hypothetical protein COW65_03550 [Cytophagales bacterium CG18_big_fil_WC_8_21_14_2_50_42_9]|nr:MAG: hypothetical protein COW65_03550 [Cytophagales bacterium CG18_big_fil_WC_8_21_14_2_50_42_9]